MDLIFLAYPVVGLLSGLLAGLLGIGGGLVIVPALLLILPYQTGSSASVVHVAVATSLATVIMTAAVATYSHHRRGAVSWPIVLRMAGGLAAGAFTGAAVAGALPADILRNCYGVFALGVAAHIAFRAQPASGTVPGWFGLLGAGALIGHVSAIVGIGGGTMSVPFLRWCRLSLQHAVATSSACGLPIALGGTLGFTFLHPGLNGPVAGYIHWPAALGIGVASLLAAPLGVRLAHTVSTVALNYIFSIFLVIVGFYLLIG